MKFKILFITSTLLYTSFLHSQNKSYSSINDLKADTIFSDKYGFKWQIKSFKDGADFIEFIGFDSLVLSRGYIELDKISKKAVQRILSKKIKIKIKEDIDLNIALFKQGLRKSYSIEKRYNKDETSIFSDYRYIIEVFLKDGYVRENDMYSRNKADLTQGLGVSMINIKNQNLDILITLKIPSKDKLLTQKYNFKDLDCYLRIISYNCKEIRYSSRTRLGRLNIKTSIKQEPSNIHAKLIQKCTNI